MIFGIFRQLTATVMHLIGAQHAVAVQQIRIAKAPA
jgi:hypothetical protein